MDPFAFAAAVLALLATPGPTNSLLAASGAAVGLRRSLTLPLGEIAGYGLAISLLALGLGPAIAARPEIAVALKLLASLWVSGCAVRLWRQASGGAAIGPLRVTPRQVFLTTLLNPKALIFALVIFPQRPPLAFLPWLAGFSLLALIVALGWIGLGASLARSGGAWATPRRIGRGAALALGVFALVIGGSAIAAVV